MEETLHEQKRRLASTSSRVADFSVGYTATWSMLARTVSPCRTPARVRAPASFSGCWKHAALCIHTPPESVFCVKRTIQAQSLTHCSRERSEERRVGKEGRSRWSPYH